MKRLPTTFGLLILAQALHSIEEYVGRLWESFPPARFATGLVSDDLRLGFLVLNVSIVAFGAWCYFWPLRRSWPSATAIVLGWAAVELVNGVGHPLWTLRQGTYTPGVATAPLLFVLAIRLLMELRESGSRPGTAARRQSR
jgi:hypothetical protein